MARNRPKSSRLDPKSRSATSTTSDSDHMSTSGPRCLSGGIHTPSTRFVETDRTSRFSAR
jgi:hypothetical protein